MFMGQDMADIEILTNRVGEESRALALWRGAGPARTVTVRKLRGFERGAGGSIRYGQAANTQECLWT